LEERQATEWQREFREISAMIHGLAKSLEK
jgi:hypothetical protein